MINDSRAPGADGQCQAYHYHHQLPVMRSTQQGFIETKQEQDCSSVVKKSIIYYIDYTRVLFFYVTIYFFYNIFRYECFIRDNDPYRDGSKTGPCSLVRLRYVFCFPAIFASRSLLECSPQHGGCVQCSVCPALANCCYQPQPEQ